MTTRHCWRIRSGAWTADEVASRSGGLDASVGEGNEHVSGGQRQRLAWRGRCCDGPWILLLDEVTSALD